MLPRYQALCVPVSKHNVCHSMLCMRVCVAVVGAVVCHWVTLWDQGTHSPSHPGVMAANCSQLLSSLGIRKMMYGLK